MANPITSALARRSRVSARLVMVMGCPCWLSGHLGMRLGDFASFIGVELRQSSSIASEDHGSH
jgi:hypothetical protein